MVVVIVFGLTLIAAIAAQDLLKGLIAGFFGLMIGTIGVDPVFGTARATFGLLELYDGVPLIPALIGLFAISEAFVMLESETIVRSEDLSKAKGARWSDTLEGLWITATILVADGLDLADRPRSSASCPAPAPPSRRSSPTTIRSCSRRRRSSTAPAIRPASSRRNRRTTA